MNPAVYIWAQALVLPVGALLTLSWFGIRNRLGHEHWRMLCPKTAYPYPPETCTCRCKGCQTCNRGA